MEGAIAQIVQVTGAGGTHRLLLVFLLCLIGEGVGVGAPYVLEATWLVTGYQVARGQSPLPYVLLLILMAQAGRQFGARLFWEASRLGFRPIARLAQGLPFGRVSARSAPLLHKLDARSPFAVAAGRLLGLRIPLTLLLGARRQWRALAAGILLSSVAFDGTYLVLGAVAGRQSANPARLLPCFLAGLVMMYGATMTLRSGSRRFAEALGVGRER